jgi:hypothetical protein
LLIHAGPLSSQHGESDLRTVVNPQSSQTKRIPL